LSSTYVVLFRTTAEQRTDSDPVLDAVDTQRGFLFYLFVLSGLADILSSGVIFSMRKPSSV